MQRRVADGGGSPRRPHARDPRGIRRPALQRRRRTIAGSLLTVEEAADQAALLAKERVVIARDGTRVPIAFDTICVHADMERAVERLRAIRQRLGGME
ncbi:MAG: hypothetical protein DMF59_20530 [Acidobacteria bacterium]|nr:MAG: hypothetical protein DMF59_20530 [Acidobacteriota bacterium]